MSTLAPRFHGISTICALALAMSAACGDNGEVGEVPVDASPQPDGRAHVTTTVFLNFDGARLTKDYPNDATADISLYVRPPGVTIPPWRDGLPARAASVAAITQRIRGLLAPYDIDVVSTRPAAGTYNMIVFGGQARDLFGAGTMDMVPGADCAPQPDISFVTETATNDDVAASLAVGALATTHHIPQTVARGDCLCFDGDACRPLTGLCTIGAAETPTQGGVQTCDGPAPPPTIDEHATFLEVFGAR